VLPAELKIAINPFTAIFIFMKNVMKAIQLRL